MPRDDDSPISEGPIDPGGKNVRRAEDVARDAELPPLPSEEGDVPFLDGIETKIEMTGDGGAGGDPAAEEAERLAMETDLPPTPGEERRAAFGDQQVGLSANIPEGATVEVEQRSEQDGGDTNLGFELRALTVNVIELIDSINNLTDTLGPEEAT
jgi:hypothetical protein